MVLFPAWSRQWIAKPTRKAVEMSIEKVERACQKNEYQTRLEKSGGYWRLFVYPVTEADWQEALSAKRIVPRILEALKKVPGVRKRVTEKDVENAAKGNFNIIGFDFLAGWEQGDTITQKKEEVV